MPATSFRAEPLHAFFKALSDVAAAILLGAIALYRRGISPLLGPACRRPSLCVDIDEYR